MKTYKDYLIENGIDPAFAEKHLSVEEKQHIEKLWTEASEAENSCLEFEKLAHAKQAANKNDNDVKDILKLVIGTKYPQKDFKPEFRGIYEGWLVGASENLFRRAEFELADGDIKIKGSKKTTATEPEPEQPKTELEKLLNKAKISFDRKEAPRKGITMDDLLRQTFVDTGAFKFQIK